MERISFFMPKFTSKSAYNIAVVGATGIVGRKIIEILEERRIPIDRFKAIASYRSVGQRIRAFGQEHAVEALHPDVFRDMDVVFFSAGSTVSERYASSAVRHGALVIDNSNAHRMKGYPLLVPGVNDHDMRFEGIIANPNCSTIQSVHVLSPLKRVFGLKSVNYTTYQSVSGSGQKGLDEFARTRVRKTCELYEHPIAETCLPKIDTFRKNGYTAEEMKMVNETQVILSDERLKVSATCVRVPIEYGHAVSMVIELDRAVALDEIHRVLKTNRRLSVVDEKNNEPYPTTTRVKDTDLIMVGRIRKDLIDPKRMLLYCTADNVRVGAASNAVRILTSIIERVEDR
jgi:aspartate-semialdehyde dehydrogenase